MEESQQSSVPDAWTIPTLDSPNNLDAHVPYTIFSEQHVYSARALIKHAFSNVDNIKDYVFFKPERLLLHALIAEYCCRIQNRGEGKMREDVTGLLELALIRFGAELKTYHQAFAQDFLNWFNTGNIAQLKQNYHQLIVNTATPG